MSEAEVTAALEQLNAPARRHLRRGCRRQGGHPGERHPLSRDRGPRVVDADGRPGDARRQGGPSFDLGVGATGRDSSPSTPGRSGASPSRGSWRTSGRTTAWSTIQSRSTPARAPSPSSQVAFPVSASASRVGSSTRRAARARRRQDHRGPQRPRSRRSATSKSCRGRTGSRRSRRWTRGSAS